MKVAAPRRGRWLELALLALLLAFVAVIRIRLLEVPLERDEGEYAYIGRLMLEGVPPYAQAYNMKFPGIYACYAAVLALFGSSGAGVHLGLLLANAAAIVLVWRLGRRLLGGPAALMAATCYALLSLSPSVLGLAAHATHFVLVPALAGVLVLMGARGSGRTSSFVWAGVLLGLAPVIKQHGAAFTLFGLAVVAADAWRGRSAAGGANLARARPLGRVAAYLLGAALPIALTGLLLAAAGVFGRFWFWTISYAAQYVSERSLPRAWAALTEELPQLVAPSLLLWVLAAGGLAGLWRSPADRSRARFLTALAAFSGLAVVPGFYFRAHYFVLVLPVVALLAGAAVELAIARAAARRQTAPLAPALAVLLIALPAVLTVWNERAIWFQLPADRVARAIYGTNPFPESLAIGRYIATHSAPADRIAVVGSEPEIYFYSGRRAATGYVYTYGLVEAQPYARRMQEEMIHEIGTALPRFIVLVLVPQSWQLSPGSDPRILLWTIDYVKQHYAMVGVADIPEEGETVYRWEGEAAAYAPRSPYRVVTYRRRDPPATP
jgi:4-amino-4-deoxy-L-arabinose transferase-like glycosyltransferase